MWKIAVDCAFFKGRELVGLGEVYTLDEIHGCLKSRELDGPWVTPKHKLLHLVKKGNTHVNPNFLVIVNVFPNNLKRQLAWKDSRRCDIREWEEKWIELTRMIKKIRN
ncbi:MAG: hypothetical protein QXK32_11790 [Candidatus Jordarchaeales archaeon]